MICRRAITISRGAAGVVSFVNDPSLLIKKLGRVMPKGSAAIFHEYGHYETWRFLPRLSMHERFREHVIATWRESGGEPADAAVQLPGLLGENGFVIRSARPHIFCLRPSDYMWQWPATFIGPILSVSSKWAESITSLPRKSARFRERRKKSEYADAHTAGAGNYCGKIVTVPLWRSAEAQSLCVSLQRDDLRDDVVERHFQMFCTADDVVAVHGAGECLVFIFFFTARTSTS